LSLIEFWISDLIIILPPESYLLESLCSEFGEFIAPGHLEEEFPGTDAVDPGLMPPKGPLYYEFSHHVLQVEVSLLEEHAPHPCRIADPVIGHLEIALPYCRPDKVNIKTCPMDDQDASLYKIKEFGKDLFYGRLIP